ncbi:MAG: HD-GYP domain-containing protein [Proteobacteria bacterium]|nr:HD-GYP domain-containing protein [Pseudomonadota bacterium]MBU1571126.1 HD-GYP domain-containing protein [Pseudomonadota bacterium]
MELEDKISGLEKTIAMLRMALEGAIQTLTIATEVRDPYTAGHQRRVTDLAISIGQEMGLAENVVAGIRMAGLIHDIGKLAVPAEILSKPSKINDLEFQLVKTHPEVGYDILKNIDFPWPVADIVLQHHERMNGSGYPRKLKRPDILIEARIINVADVVEAMASYRPYRPSLGIEKSLEQISRNRGILYDDEVVDACLRLFRENRFKF